MAVTFKRFPLNPEEIKRFYRNGDFSGQERPYIAEDPLHIEKNRIIIELLEKLKPEKLIEVGCGDGKLLEAAAPFTKNLAVGLDIFDKDFPSSKNNVFYIAGDAEAIPFCESAFDLVICSEVLEHLPDFEAALHEMWRILSNNGHLLITVPNLFCFDSIEAKTRVIERAVKFTNRLGGGLGAKEIFPFGWNTHIHKKTVNEWNYSIENAGFIVVDSRPIYTFPYIPHFFKPLKRLESELWRFLKAQKLFSSGEKNTFLKKMGQLHLFLCKKR